MFKVKHNLSPTIMNDIFIKRQQPYNLRGDSIWATFNVNSVYNGTETLSFRGPKTWNILPDEIKNSQSLTEFKRKIKTWKPSGCTCRLCKVYIANIGFL